MVGNHHVALVTNLGDPYNLMMQNECHGNQVGGLMQSGVNPEHNNAPYLMTQHQQQA